MHEVTLTFVYLLYLVNYLPSRPSLQYLVDVISLPNDIYENLRRLQYLS